MSKTLKFIVTASLLFNVMFLGVGGGLAYHHWKSRMAYHDVKADLKPETREMLFSHFRSVRENMQGLAEDAKQKRERAVEIMNAETFDAPAFSAAMEDLKAVQAEMAQARIAAISDIAGQLSADERRKLSAKMVDSLQKGPHDKRGHRKFQPPPAVSGTDTPGVPVLKEPDDTVPMQEETELPPPDERIPEVIEPHPAAEEGLPEAPLEE